MKRKLITWLAGTFQEEIRPEFDLCICDLIGSRLVYRPEKGILCGDPLAAGRFDLTADDMFASQCVNDTLEVFLQYCGVQHGPMDSFSDD